MVFRCPRGTSKGCRVITTSSGKRLRLCGCLRKGLFIKKGVKEVKRIPK